MTLNEKHTACSECEEVSSCWYEALKDPKYILYCNMKQDYVCNIEQCDKWDKWVKKMANRIKQIELPLFDRNEPMLEGLL
jgi:hypothetical protein